MFNCKELQVAADASFERDRNGLASSRDNF